MQFSSTLISWFNQNKRDLPWRNTKNPYLIWLSEIILQQTRVDQGTEYYHKFAKQFPTIKKLAASSEEEILKNWQGLGYYSRARNMHFSARLISEKHNGIFPDTYSDIRALKGVGDYTAAAIASFAFDQCYPVVDGNVYRFLSRYFGIKTPIDSSEGKKEFLQTAETLIDKKRPGLFNQAIMEFGALQCVPKNPSCDLCPFKLSCSALENNKVSELPVKEKKVKVKDRYFNYLVIKNKGKVLMRQRAEKDIWKGLYEFPMIETKKEIELEELLLEPGLKTYLPDDKFLIKGFSLMYKHILTHQRLFARFIEIESASILVESKSLKKVNKTELEKLAVPRLIEKYLNKEF